MDLHDNFPLEHMLHFEVIALLPFKNKMYNFCQYFFCSFLPMHFWEEDGVGEFQCTLLTNNNAPGVRNLHFLTQDDPGHALGPGN